MRLFLVTCRTEPAAAPIPACWEVEAEQLCGAELWAPKEKEKLQATERLMVGLLLRGAERLRYALEGPGRQMVLTVRWHQLCTLRSRGSLPKARTCPPNRALWKDALRTKTQVRSMYAKGWGVLSFKDFCGTPASRSTLCYHVSWESTLLLPQTSLLFFSKTVLMTMKCRNMASPVNL